MQMRLLELEYSFPEMSDDEIKEKVGRIYLEEKGEPLLVDIDIYRMNEKK